MLDQAQHLSNEGYCAFGFVAYEAASGFDPQLVTSPPDPNLPLVWFGISREPSRTTPVQPVMRQICTEISHAANAAVTTPT